MYVVPHEGLTFLSCSSGKTKDDRDYHSLSCYDSFGRPYTFYLSSNVDKSTINALNSFSTGDIIYPLFDVRIYLKGIRMTVSGFVNYSN